MDALAPKKRGRKAAEPHPLARRVAELERDNERLQRRLQQAETIIVERAGRRHTLRGEVVAERVWAPVRDLAAALGAEVSWDGETRTAWVRKGLP